MVGEFVLIISGLFLIVFVPVFTTLAAAMMMARPAPPLVSEAACEEQECCLDE